MNAPIGETRTTSLKGVVIQEGHKSTSVSWELHHPAYLVQADDRIKLMVFTTAGEAQRYFITHPNHKSVAKIG